MPVESFDIKRLVTRLERDGNIKVHSYSESTIINQRINEGLDTFVKEEKKKELEANNKAATKVLNC